MSPDKLNQLKSKLESLADRTLYDDEVMDKMKGKNPDQQVLALQTWAAEAILAENLLQEFFGESE